MITDIEVEIRAYVEAYSDQKPTHEFTYLQALLGLLDEERRRANMGDLIKRIHDAIEAFEGENPFPVSPPPAPPPVYDAEERVARMAAQKQLGDGWRTSTVDLLNVLGIDSSEDHRKALAAEFGWGTGDDSSADMNEFLHGKIMQEVAEHGSVP